jgi:hypothetical protein
VPGGGRGPGAVSDAATGVSAAKFCLSFRRKKRIVALSSRKDVWTWVARPSLDESVRHKLLRKSTAKVIVNLIRFRNPKKFFTYLPGAWKRLELHS